MAEKEASLCQVSDTLPEHVNRALFSEIFRAIGRVLCGEFDQSKEVQPPPPLLMGELFLNDAAPTHTRFAL